MNDWNKAELSGMNFHDKTICDRTYICIIVYISIFPKKKYSPKHPSKVDHK